MAPPTQIAIAVVEHQGRFLIGKRGPGVPLAGLWEFPGGKLDAGESLAEAASRECEEETGLRVVVGKVYSQFVHEYDYGALQLSFFACRPVDPLQPPRLPFRWVPARELAEYEFPPANHALVRYLAERYETKRSGAKSSAAAKATGPSVAGPGR